jgi:lipid II:glycine glycyltransferase (peptidoglycan interpeptide bridge formation enzyme)
MELKIASDNDEMEWNNIVEDSPNGTMFHTWKWLKLMEKHSSRKIAGIQTVANFYPVFIVEKNVPIGIFPLYFFKHPAFNSCYSPPQNMEVLYLGPLFSDLKTMKEEKKQIFFVDVQKEIDLFMKNKLKSNFILINTPPGFEDSRSFQWAGYTAIPRYTYYINLNDGKEKIWDNLSRTLKQDINKVKKKGIHVDIGSRNDVEFIYDFHKKRNRIRSNKEYLLDIFDHFAPKNLTVFVAKHGNEPLSGVITLCHKNKVYFWVGTPRVSYEGTTPNTYIYWEAINWAIENGYEIFEIMGADEFTLFPYKRKYNGKIVQFYQMKWVSPVFNVFSSIYYSLKKR